MWTVIDMKRELIFLLRQKNVQLLLFVAFLLSAFSVTTGIIEIEKQKETITRLAQYDEIDQKSISTKRSGFGSIAYYTRHLTYAPPSDLAFAAIGQRDVMSWKHRVNMLALEGQIYENDADNPELAYVGRIDFAFIIAILVPLFVILLLHDVKASERASGRYELLLTTSKNPNRLWLTRIWVGAASLSIALLIPFLIGAIISNSNLTTIATVIFICIAQVSFWALICNWVAKKNTSAPQLASILLGIWLLTTVIIPVSSEKIIGLAVESPKGGDIVLTQREAVNDAWDIPYAQTFEPFLARHPEWKDYVDMPAAFDWKWYYAFQQVGDQTAEPLSNSYTKAIVRKNELAGIVAWLSPAMLVQRSLTSLAQTDTKAMLAYNQSIRYFHTQLRHFYYPYLFKGIEYDVSVLDKRPTFKPNR